MRCCRHVYDVPSSERLRENMRTPPDGKTEKTSFFIENLLKKNSILYFNGNVDVFYTGVKSGRLSQKKKKKS